MKKLNNILGIFCCMFALLSCDSDRDSNPVLQTPTSFVLNVPPYATAVYDLKNSETLELTTSQPDFGFTAATSYSVQISTKGSFDEATGDVPNYVTLPTAYTTARMDVDATELAVAIVGLLGITDEADYPIMPIKLYIRLKASPTASKNMEVLSNIIELPQILGYFALDAMTLPENMYIIGSINDWNWANSYAMIQTHSNPGKLWSVQYFPAGAEIKFNSNQAWDGGDIGYAEDCFSQSSIALAGLDDSGGNIKINNAGWYIVVVTATVEGRSYKYNIEFLPPNVYLFGGTNGGDWEAKEANLFTVPADGTGDFVSPAFKASDELRMCIVLDGIDWWKTEFIILGGKIAYRATGDDQDRVQVTAGQKAYLNFLTGVGYIK
ncbi:outer membrane protein SusE [Bacteroidia bacterium]|nr:outer membrane protein SusE [Bacteroidia bacterium]